MEMHIYIHNYSYYIQAKEFMDKINPKALSETSIIKAGIQSTMYIVKKIDQDHIW